MTLFRPPHDRARARRTLWALLVGLAMAGGLWAQSPVTVNGLFWGDGDDASYTLWNTSYYGSELYVYYHAPTTTIYVALVVDRSVNDNVFGPDDFSPPPDYMRTADWGRGGGQQRGASRLVDSEFASFEFACAPGSPRNWAWQQGYACVGSGTPQTGTWVSDATCGASTPLTPPGNGYPPSLASGSSFARNMTVYNAAVTKPWNRDVFSSMLSRWRAPYSASNPSTVPPNDPDTVVGLEGYPAATGGDPTMGPHITYNNTYAYEWPMVYEWSLDLGPGGADCQGNNLFLVTGSSHHSPMKSIVEGMFDAECGEENDCFPVNGNNPLSDFGDLPDTYGTLEASGGPRHPILISAPYLGNAVEIENDGSPTVDATGDGAEESGVDAVVDSNWTAGSSQQIEVTVSSAPSGALLGGWFDWNDDGDFDDPGEFFSWNVSEGTANYPLTVGSSFDWETDTLYSRFRLFSSGAAAPGGSLDQGDSVGAATDGEVEDYRHAPGALPVTLNAFASEGGAGGPLTVRWQTASETDNVGFEVWGRVDGEWRALTELVASQGGSSALPQTYEIELDAPAGLDALELVDYDSRGRQERFGSFPVGRSRGEFQPVERVDWSGPRAERRSGLERRGFGPAGRGRTAPAKGASVEPSGAANWKRLHRGRAVRGESTTSTGALSRRGSRAAAAGPTTHLAVTEPGIQRVTYETLVAGGLDLAGVDRNAVAVTWRGQPVERTIAGRGAFGPGSAIEFLGQPPVGSDALYIDANLYQVTVDRRLARRPRTGGATGGRNLSTSYLREVSSDRPLLYNHQSPTGDPWVESSVLTTPTRPRTVTLDLPVEGPVVAGPGRLVIGLGTITDLPELSGAGGAPLPEHNVEVWFRGASSGLAHVTTASTSGQTAWVLEAPLPAGSIQPGTNQVELRFSTDYTFSLVVIDRYELHYPSRYLGPSVDFAPDATARGYRIEGFSGPDVVAVAEAADGSSTRFVGRAKASGAGYALELPNVEAERFWVTEAPHLPEVFTTAAPPDLFAEPGDLVVLAGSSFIGTPALDDYLAQRADLDPVVVDVEDVLNAVGYGMALPSAITEYLAARDAVRPFTHVQLVGTDCYDRLGYLSDCISFVPLPTATVGASRFSPSQNLLVDLDGDGVGDKAVGQFSVRDAGELQTIVDKGATWAASDLPGSGTALLIAEESDGVNDFSAQVERIRVLLDGPRVDRLYLAEHEEIGTAREAMRSALDEGRAVTVFSGHSSPVVWGFRGLLTPASVATLTNDDNPTLMLPLACETTYDISPSANVLGHQLLFGGDQGAVAISGAVALSSLEENERMVRRVLEGLEAGGTLGEAVQAGREALGLAHRELLDNWITQGDVATRLVR